MALTLIEAAKAAYNSGNMLAAGLIRTYAESNPLFQYLSFDSIAGNAVSYNQEDTLPGVGFRGINEAYPESTGIINPQTERLVIAGGDLDVDKFLIATMGQSTRATQEAMKIRSLALAWVRTFIKGSSLVNPREFDGLQTRVTGTQLLSAGNTAGGDPLSLAVLDEAIDKVPATGNTVIIMNNRLKLRLQRAATNSNVAGYINFEADQFGQRLMSYAGLPILVMGDDNNKDAILPFTESNPGGGTPASSSLYVVAFGDPYVQGIQNSAATGVEGEVVSSTADAPGGAMRITDLGELQSKPSLRTRVEWYAGVKIMDGRAVCRVQGITDAAVVA